MPVILHHYYRSSCSYRVRIALELKGIAYESKFINLRGKEQCGEEYLRFNPQALVPVIEMEGVRLTQSMAIIEYLDEILPDVNRLLPADPRLRAEVRECVCIITSDIQPVNNLRILNYLTENLSCTEENKIFYCQEWINKGFSVLEEKLTTNSYLSKPFAFSDQPGLFELCLVPQIYNAIRYEVNLEPYPRLMEIYQNCIGLHAFKKAHPDQFILQPSRENTADATASASSRATLFNLG